MKPNLRKVRYNLAHVRALRGEFAAAAEWTLHAAESARTGAMNGVYLLLYLPAPRTWSPPDAIWSTAAVAAADVAGTLLAQARCLEALAGKYDRAEFAQVVGDTADLGVAALRVLGWTWLTRFNDSSEAERLFDAALADASEQDADVLQHELDYARRDLSSS
ncbi:MAG: hypothetical protein QOH58_891 [Thermoleophilaceae bacterium]|jgi:hypothetical protein|nr:hypothetical protein [Thermoleophilaceae bacterium]